MQETLQDLNIFKLNKLPQFPKLAKLDLNNIIGEHSDDNSKLIIDDLKHEKKINYSKISANNKEDNIIFQLGPTINKKKFIEVTKNEEDIQQINQLNEKKNDFLDEYSQNSSIFTIQKVYDETKSIYEENNRLRNHLKKEISDIIDEIKNYKENIVDYWIELTLLQSKKEKKSISEEINIKK